MYLVEKIKTLTTVRNLIATYKVNILKKYYTNNPQQYIKGEELYIIYMADGRLLHGGLSDRLCGLVSLYYYCIEHNKKFKAYWSHPYALQEYLLPNKYDWTINEKELSYNKKESSPIYVSCYYCSLDKFKKILNNYLCKDKKQLHVYTNIRYFNSEFGRYFFELFKPTKPLEELISYNLSKINDEYISITFRFQQLLGDFREGSFSQLKTEKEKRNLINKCISTIESIKKQNQNINKILVTSDSKSFLSSLKVYSYIYTIPGNIAHIDFSKENNFAINAKSFVDFFMISKAKKVYLVYSDILYKSSFAHTASMLHRVPYEEIKI